MKSLVYGCAAAALLLGLAAEAQAEIIVRQAPVHTVPADEDDASDAAPAAQPDASAPAAAPVRDKAEPAAVQALTQPKAPPVALTPQENAFFAVLGRRVTDAASAYESYVRRAGAIDPAFSGAASVQRAVNAGAGYHPVQLEEGVIAYAALIALRDSDFVDGVRAIDNPAFADGLASHPEQVMQVRGAAVAAADVAGVLQAQGERLIAEGKAITKAAYDIQAQAWSKSPVADPKGVLDRAKASAQELRVATTPSKEKLLDSLASAPQAPSAGAGASPDVERGLALAALAILGKTGDGAEARYEALLHDASSAECLKMAKLNLNQCLAVAGPHYEDVYCAGRHAVSDTGKCIAAAAGDGNAAPAPRLPPAEVPKTETIGPEQAAAYGKTPTPDDADDDEAAPTPRPAAAPAPPPQPYSYAQNDDAPPQPPPAQYGRGAYAPAYPQPQYPQAGYPQAYPQAPYAPQDYQRPYPDQSYRQGYAAQSPGAQGYPSQAYAGQAYPPAPRYAPSYGAQQPYYPQAYSGYQAGYYGR